MLATLARTRASSSGRHRLPQGRIGELPSLLRKAGREQRHDPLGDQRAPTSVRPWSEVERLAGQLGCGGGIGGTEDAGSLERGLDRDLIARLCAGDELGGHLDRKRTAGEQHLRRAPVDGTPDRESAGCRGRPRGECRA